MQAIHNYSKKYIDPVLVHPLTQSLFQVTLEAVKILGAKYFLHYLCDSSLIDPTKVSQNRKYQTIVLAPIQEECFFRFAVLGGIYLIQSALNKIPCQIVSPLFDKNKDLHHQMKESHPAIDLYLPPEMDVLNHGVKKVRHVIGQLTFQKPKDSENENGQRVFRIYLAALIFAAAHLENFHRNKMTALIQFSWSFIGGVIYGQLTEKYGSICPAMIVHGVNNTLATMLSYSSKDTERFLLIALIVNRVASYILSVTQIDRSALQGLSRIPLSCVSFPIKFFNSTKELKTENKLIGEEESLDVTLVFP